MRTDDLITTRRFLEKLPSIMRRAPRMLQGLAMAAATGPDSTAGLGWALERATHLNPNGRAVLYRETTLTYAAFNAWANRIAHHFQASGLRKGDVVVVLMENRPALLAVAAGLAKLGVISALVNTAQKGRILEHSLNLVSPRAAIVGEELLDAFGEVSSRLHLDAAAVYCYPDPESGGDSSLASRYRNLETEIAAQPSHNPATTRQVKGHDGLFYIYTSGTTGLPKAAIMSQGRFMKVYAGLGHSLPLGPGDVIYVPLPFYHATAMVACWGSALAGTAGVALRRRFSVSEFWNDVRHYDATAFGYVGELCRYLMDRPLSPDDRRHRVRTMLGNGLRPTIWTAFKRRFGIDNVMELYGSSEGNVGFSNVFNFDNTVGFCPVPYKVVRFDRETEQPVRGENGFMIECGRGEPGLLVAEISARNPFDGYTDAARNAACILTDVFRKGDRYFNTGDLMRDIGFRHAQFVDRTGDTFRWKGENVSSTEVENVMGLHPALEHAVVYGVEIPGTNGRAGMAAIKSRGEFGEAARNDLLARLRKELPPYAIPVFLRVQSDVVTTGTFKYQKAPLKTEGFDPALTGSDVLFVLLPGTDRYVALTPELYEQIRKEAFRF